MKRLLFVWVVSVFCAWPVASGQERDSVGTVKNYTVGIHRVQVTTTELDDEQFYEAVSPDEIRYYALNPSIFDSLAEPYRIMLDFDSIRSAIGDRVKFEYNKYDWMNDEKEYISSFTVARGRKIVFRAVYPVSAYFPDLDIITFGWWDNARFYPTNIETGQLEPFPHEIIVSDNNSYRIIQALYPNDYYTIQYWDTGAERFMHLCTLGDLGIPEAAQVFWRSDTLYLYTSYYSPGSYIKIDFTKL